MLGVRANTHEVAELLRQVFTDRVVPAAAPPGNLSVRLAAAQAGVQELHRLYIGTARVLRTRSVARAVETLWHELDLRDAEASQHLVLLSATVLIRDGAAHLVPSIWRRAVLDQERQWRDAGFRLVDRRFVALDAASGTIDVPDSGLAGATEAIRGAVMAAGLLDRDEASAHPAGRFPIRNWVLPPAERTLAARVVESAGQVVHRTQHDGEALINALAAFLPQLSVPVWHDMKDLRGKLAST